MGSGFLRFLLKQAKQYSYTTSKPWQELEGKNILHNTKTSYTVLEDVSEAPCFTLDTGRTSMSNLIEEFGKQNELKRNWNPWDWSCFYGSTNTTTLTPAECKELLNIWNDIWEFCAREIDNSPSESDSDDSEPSFFSNKNTIYHEGITIRDEAREVLEYAVEHYCYLEIYTSLN